VRGQVKEIALGLATPLEISPLDIFRLTITRFLPSSSAFCLVIFLFQFFFTVDIA